MAKTDPPSAYCRTVVTHASLNVLNGFVDELRNARALNDKSIWLQVHHDLCGKRIVAISSEIEPKTNGLQKHQTKV